MRKMVAVTLGLVSILLANASQVDTSKMANQIASQLQSYLPYRLDDITIIHSATSNENIVTILKSIDMATFASRILQKPYKNITDKEKEDVFVYVQNSFTELQPDVMGACSDTNSRNGIDAGVVMFYRYIVENASRVILETRVDKKTCQEINKKPLF